MSLSALPAGMVEAIAELVEERSGLRFAGARDAELSAKLARAFAAAGCASWDEWLRRLRTPGSAALRRLLEALTVGETYFFRHRAYFDAIEQEVVPRLIAARRPARQLRAWCAACATGEEAYSLAILLQRGLAGLPGWRADILATDLNDSFLARAAAGVYGDWSFRETDDRFKATYFTREGRHYRIRPELRALVRFARLNLVEDHFPSPATGTVALDLILCRNVLIYFAPETSARIVERLHAALAPGGWLVLGPSDPLPGLLRGFEAYEFAGAIVYRRAELHQPPPHRSPPVGGTLSWTSASAMPGEQSGRRPRVAGPETMGVRQRPPSPQDRPPETTTARAEPDWREALRVARASADRGLLEEAEAHCRRAIAQATLRPEPYYLLGTLREAQGDAVGARHAFRQALYADRAFVPAHLALAACHRRAGRPELAEQALAQARRLLAGRPDDELVLAEEGLTVGRLRDALARAVDETTRKEGR